MQQLNSNRSSAISHPRGRRYPFYENQNEEALEIGYAYETKLIFTEFDHDGGYKADVLENMHKKITTKYPKFEIVHAKLGLLNYYFDSSPTEDENQNHCCPNEDLRIASARILLLIREIDQHDGGKISKIYENLVEAVQIETEILTKLATDDGRPCHDIWDEFIQTIHKLNFWCLQADVCSDFNRELGRKGLKTNFCDIIFAKIEALIVFWLDDFHFLEFNSAIKLVEPSDDMLGEELDTPFSMDWNACQMGGSSMYCGIGLIQSDHFELRISIRFITQNMISANLYNGKPYKQPRFYHKPMNDVTSACVHDHQVNSCTFHIFVKLRDTFRLNCWRRTFSPLSRVTTSIQICLQSLNPSELVNKNSPTECAFFSAKTGLYNKISINILISI